MRPMLIALVLITFGVAACYALIDTLQLLQALYHGERALPHVIDMGYDAIALAAYFFLFSRRAPEPAAT